MASAVITDTAGDRPGARIETDDLATLIADPDFAPALLKTLERHLVVLLRAKTIDAPAFAALTEILGTPRPPRSGGGVPGFPTVQLFKAAARPDATWQEAEDISHILHVDYSNLEAPPAFSIQHQRSETASPLPARWVDMRRAHAGLPPALQRRIAPLRAMHSPFADQVNVKVQREVADMPAEIRASGTLHPLVCRHETSGAPFLFLPVRRDSLIPGMDAAESRALLTELWDAVEAAPSFSTPVRTGEIAIWDNMAAVHTRAPFPLTIPREVWFSTIHGAAPQAADAGRLAAE